MLAEHYVASIASPRSAPNTSHTKDVGIFVHELQPLVAQRAAFKKSATPPNCLAVSDGHVFAAQAGKAVVHVYSRDKGNQEAIVPFPEQITAIALAAEDTVLALGTASGQLLFWEICTGRLVTSPQSHLQAITCLAVDQTSNHLLSGSSDSTVLVWPLAALLSFSQSTSLGAVDPRQPLQTLSKHRGEITAIALGSNRGAASIAVTASGDAAANGAETRVGQGSSVIVWDYLRGTALRTYLLDSIPRALVLDILGRGFYTTYDDASVQLVDFYSDGQRQAVTHATNGEPSIIIQPRGEKRWRYEGTESSELYELGPGRCLMLSWDGTRLLSGHDTGKIVCWEVGTGKGQPLGTPLPGPVTNLVGLPVLLPGRPNPSSFKVHTVVKPRVGGSSEPEDGSFVPPNYSFTCQPVGHLPVRSMETGGRDDYDIFDQALTHPSFPSTLLEEGLAELATFQAGGPSQGASSAVPEDVMKLDVPAPEVQLVTDDDRVEKLQDQVRRLQAVQRASFARINELRRERVALRKELDRREWVEEQERRRREGGKGPDGGADHGDEGETSEESSEEAESEEDGSGQEEHVGRGGEVEMEDGKDEDDEAEEDQDVASESDAGAEESPRLGVRPSGEEDGEKG